MQRYIAFLRGMNLGKRRLPMSRLKELFEELGFNDVETFIASGNVLFSSKVKNPRRWNHRLPDILKTPWDITWILLCARQRKSPRLAARKFFPKMAGKESPFTSGFFNKNSRLKSPATGRRAHCSR